MLTLPLSLNPSLHRATRVSELEAEVFRYRQQLQHMADIQQVRGGGDGVGVGGAAVSRQQLQHMADIQQLQGMEEAQGETTCEGRVKGRRLGA